MKISTFLRTAGLTGSLLAVSGFVFAQDQIPAPNPQSQAPSNGGWRRVGDTNPAPAPDPSSAPNPAYNQGPQGQPNPNQPPPPPIPSKLTIQPGTYVTVR